MCKLLKKNHFPAVCKFKKKSIERVAENETNMEVFSVKNKIKNVKKKKIGQKKKDIILKIKINNFDLHMQVDTVSELRLIPKNSWERAGNPTLRKSSLQLC